MEGVEGQEGVQDASPARCAAQRRGAVKPSPQPAFSPCCRSSASSGLPCARVAGPCRADAPPLNTPSLPLFPFRPSSPAASAAATAARHALTSQLRLALDPGGGGLAAQRLAPLGRLVAAGQNIVAAEAAGPHLTAKEAAVDGQHGDRQLLKQGGRGIRGSGWWVRLNASAVCAHWACVMAGSRARPLPNQRLTVNTRLVNTTHVRARKVHCEEIGVGVRHRLGAHEGLPQEARHQAAACCLPATGCCRRRCRGAAGVLLGKWLAVGRVVLQQQQGKDSAA